MNSKEKKTKLTKIFDFDLTEKEKKMSQDEISKKITKEKIKRKHHQLINTALSLTY